MSLAVASRLLLLLRRLPHSPRLLEINGTGVISQQPALSPRTNQCDHEEGESGIVFKGSKFTAGELVRFALFPRSPPSRTLLGGWRANASAALYPAGVKNSAAATPDPPHSHPHKAAHSLTDCKTLLLTIFHTAESASEPEKKKKTWTDSVRAGGVSVEN